MAVPKRKLSRSNTRHRRANWKTTAPDLVDIQVDGRSYAVPRRLLRGIERGYVDLTRLR